MAMGGCVRERLTGVDPPRARGDILADVGVVVGVVVFPAGVAAVGVL